MAQRTTRSRSVRVGSRRTNRTTRPSQYVTTETTRRTLVPERDLMREKSPLAIVSLVLGIISIPSIFASALSLIFALGAIITGFMALSRIRRDGTEGRSMAIWGIILGVITIVLFLILIVILGLIGITVLNSFTMD